VSVVGLGTLAPGRPLRCVLHHEGGGEDAFEVRHTMNDEQIRWFKAGSALNLLRAQPAR
jgi:aconitate hydratase